MSILEQEKLSGATILKRFAQQSVGGLFVSTPARRLCERIELVTYDGIENLRDLWKTMEAEGNASIYQRYDWVKICLETVNAGTHQQPFIVVGYDSGHATFILPFIIEGKFFKKLKWIGGKHSNYNMPIFSNYFLDHYNSRDINVIFKRILRMLPGVDMVELKRQPVNWEEKLNPFIEVPHIKSTNPAFEMNMEGGLAGVLSQVNGKRKRKKFKNQKRTCEKLGGYNVIVPQTDAEAMRLINVFKSQKALRFRKLGIKNVFSGPETEHFLDLLALQSVSENPIVRLYGLEIDGEIRAIYGGGISGTRFSGYFCSISEDELSSISPGEMLLYLLVDDCAERGYGFLDLGAGEERYKRSWCTGRIELFDTIVPIAFYAYPVCWYAAVTNFIKRNARSNETIWTIIRNIRKLKAKLLMVFQNTNK